MKRLTKRLLQLLPLSLALACGGSDAPQWPTDTVLKCLPELSPEEVVKEALAVATSEDPAVALAELGQEYGPKVALCSAKQALSRLSEQRSARGADGLRSALSATGVRFQED